SARADGDVLPAFRARGVAQVGAEPAAVDAVEPLAPSLARIERKVVEHEPRLEQARDRPVLAEQSRDLKPGRLEQGVVARRAFLIHRDETDARGCYRAH